MSLRSRYYLLCLFFGICVISSTCQENIKSIGINEVEQLKQNVDRKTLVFFEPPNCDTCDSYNEALTELSSFLSPSVSFVKVTAENVPWCETCKLPALVILHKKRQVYVQDSAITTDSVQHALNLVETCHAFRLSDQNFEHDTQAATGGTTGDWLVILDDVRSECQDMLYEGLALRLRPHGVNVAILSSDSSRLTYKRFEVQSTPSVLFIRRGSLYRFDHHFDAKKMEHLYQFASKWYKEMRKSSVPRELFWFDDFTDQIVSWLKENTSAVPPGVIRAILLAFVIAFGFFAVLVVVCWPSEGQKANEKKQN